MRVICCWEHLIPREEVFLNEIISNLVFIKEIQINKSARNAPFDISTITCLPGE